MILLIDNYDSFVYNLSRYCQELGHQTIVVRNDAITLSEVQRLSPTHIILSPGPARPEQAGMSIEIISHFYRELPILGVCLGHQAIGYCFGASIICSPPRHGKKSLIKHTGTGLFKNLPNPLSVGRYHSLCIEEKTLPTELKIMATTDDGIIMGVQHYQYPLYGVQFHPESVLTDSGHELLSNFFVV